MYRQCVLLNALMLTCLSTVIAGAIRRFLPDWQPVFVIAALSLVALEAGIVHRTYRRNRMWSGEFVRYLAPELLVMLALMRLAVSLSFGGNLFADAERWLRNPLSIFDIAFLMAIAAAFFIGTVTHTVMQAILDLLPQEFEQAQSNDDNGRVTTILAQDRVVALRVVNTRFIVGGIFVLLALGLETVNIQRLAAPATPPSLMSGVAALLYFVCGFLLYSQARLALLSARWRLDGSVVSPMVFRRWARSSWLMIGGVGLITAVLPRTYGLGILDTIRAGFGIIGYVFVLFGYAVIWLFSLIALLPALLLSMFAGTGSMPQAPPFVPPDLPPPPPPSDPPGEPNLVSAMLFWVCMLLLVGYAVFTIMQRHPLLVERVLMRGPIRRFVEWLRELWRDTCGWVAVATAKISQQLQRPARPLARSKPLIRLAALAPRDLVRYFYHSTLRRAAEDGIPRKPGQTPAEYRETLSRVMPETDEDMATLTESFVRAQYSPRDVAKNDAQQVRGPWQRLRARLRQK